MTTVIMGRRGIILFVVAVTALAVVAMFMDWREVRSMIGHATLTPLPIAILFTGLSYGTYSYGFAFVSALFGIRLPKRDIAVAGFVSSALANMTSLGGVAGYSMRIIVLNRRGLTSAETLGPSIFHSYLTDLLLVAMVPVGLTILVLRHPLSRTVEIELAVAALVLVLVFAAGSVTLFSARFRRMLLGHFEKFWKKIFRREMAATIWELDRTLADGVGAAGRQPRSLLVPVGLVILDWAFLLATISFCFRALGADVAPGVLVTGTSVGIVAGLISMIPGGLGVQEGSMAGIYSLLGIQFEQALLASILFRVVYYFVPYLASLVLYRRLFGHKGRWAERDNVGRS